MAENFPDPESVVRALQRLRSEGADLSSSRLRYSHPTLLSAAKRRFGSYAAAVRAAGIDYSQICRLQYWTKKRVLAELRQRHREGIDLSHVALGRTDRPLLSAAEQYFGNYRSAIRAAGIDYQKVSKRLQRRWTDQQVLDALRDARRRGQDLSLRQMRSRNSRLVHAARSHFGSYAKAVQAAGISYLTVRRNKKWTAARVLREIRRRQRLGKELSYRAVQRHCPHLFFAAQHFFGIYRRAVEAAGIDYLSVSRRVLEYWTDEQILQELRRMQKDGEDLSMKVVMRHAPKLIARCRNHFGSYAKAVQAAGIDYATVRHPQQVWTEQKVLQTLRELDERGEDMRVSFLAKRVRGIVPAANKLFGTYRKAVAAAGLQYRDGRRVSRSGSKKLAHWNEELVLSTLRELQEQGEDLRHRTVKDKRQPLFWAAKDFFGSYVNAVRQAGIDYWQMSQEQLRRSRPQANGETAGH